jgi:hypothetical protein
MPGTSRSITYKQAYATAHIQNNLEKNPIIFEGSLSAELSVVYMASSMQPFESVMAPASLMGCLLANGDEYVRCSRCLFGGCDVRVEGCGCTMHVVSFAR